MIKVKPDKIIELICLATFAINQTPVLIISINTNVVDMYVRHPYHLITANSDKKSITIWNKQTFSGNEHMSRHH